MVEQKTLTRVEVPVVNGHVVSRNGIPDIKAIVAWPLDSEMCYLEGITRARGVVPNCGFRIDKLSLTQFCVEILGALGYEVVGPADPNADILADYFCGDCGREDENPSGASDLNDGCRQCGRKICWNCVDGHQCNSQRAPIKLFDEGKHCWACGMVIENLAVDCRTCKVRLCSTETCPEFHECGEQRAQPDY